MKYSSNYLRLTLLLGLFFCSGCSRINRYLGADGDYMLKAYDVLARPGQRVQLTARLQSGTIQRDLAGRNIRFVRNGWLAKKVVTDDEGYGLMDFTPARPGNYLFSIQVDPAGLKSTPPEPVELLVACRASNEPMAIIDVDKTLAQTKSWRFFSQNPVPLAGSVDVMQRLAKEYTIVYVTHRPQQYAHHTKAWLARHSYPTGPLLMPEVVDFARGSRRYKTRELAKLKSDFPNIRIGIGDKISDIQAYHDNGLRAFLILNDQGCDDPDDYLELAQKLDLLQDDVQVVGNWSQIASVVYQGRSFPRSAAQKELRRKSQALHAIMTNNRN